MGVYLNSTAAYTLFKGESEEPYFVDKSQMLEELFPFIKKGNSHICLTRPRRFGKTVMANMAASFFSKACDSSGLFQKLQISKSKDYERYRNKFSVIQITWNDTGADCHSYHQYMERILGRLIRDLKREYPDVRAYGTDAADFLMDIYAENPDAGFIFILDEWDYIFYQDYATEQDKKAYLQFLRSLLKDKPYVLLTYMTGILPIAKYTSGSELNMFAEFTMSKSPAFSDYFGFTEAEVMKLHERYLNICECPKITLEDLKNWYDGYHTASGERVYNPRSVVSALRFNHLENYWTSAGPYDEIFYYAAHNIDDIRDDLALLVSGYAVPAKIQEYAAASMKTQTKDEIMSAMVVYGFLSYENGKVKIPNKELMEKFEEMLRAEPSLGYVHRLAKMSERMLLATLAGDTDTMSQILEAAHDAEVPILSYNHETELAAVVNLVYLSARDTYRVEREEKAGKGFVDFIFYPEADKSADCMILELKVGHTPKEALRQIKEKNYALRFRVNASGDFCYTGRVLGVGISYDKKTKVHTCAVEVLYPSIREGFCPK